MRDGVHHFQVHQEQVAGVGDAADDVRRCEERRVHGAVEAPAAQFGQQFQRVLGVQERFSTAQGDASAAVRHHAALLFDLGHQFFQGPFAAADFHRQGRAGVGAGAAYAAGPPGGADALRGELQRPLRAGLHAGGAADALGTLVQSLRTGRPAFGIVAPDAAERAPFQEEGGPDAGTVVEGVTLEVEQECHSANLLFFAYL